MARHGDIAWTELNTWDPVKARAFYEETLGWRFSETPMPDGGAYLTAAPAKDDEPGEIGVFPLTSPTFDGIPAHWLTYFEVEDIDVAVEATRQAGGAVLRAPFDLAHGARIAILKDPTDAPFGIIRSPEGGIARPPLDHARKPPHGARVWTELNTWNAAAARKFYTAVLGWDFDDMQQPGASEGVMYGVAKISDEMVAGMIQLVSPQGDGVPSNWMVYFEVADVDASAAATVKAGGAVLAPPFDIPRVGRFAIIADATKAVSGLMTSVEPMAG